ncbi:hypothetical protein HPP92_021847 [Vanilla planifolia]|uniref:CDP-diacylglycerol--serine O-phosphatidyltransferase n=1 Tax=Vanilla planifolia TaxID=51239 RepID=A0A835PZM7_VANPL|nr:hypothetical protein HPP92_021847 [Vanilla planifolia]
MEVNGLKKSMKRDVVIFKDSDIKSMNDLGEFDPWTAWAYKPRTISLLLFGTCLIIWASGALNPESKASNDVVASVTRGIWAMITVFLAYSLLQAPSTVLIRPHPAIWRLVHGMAVVYLVALTFLLFQNRDDARKFMKFLHPDLGIELPERSYGIDCRIYVPDNPKSRFNNETLFDEFVLAHIFGWWGKAIMIRNQSLLWVLSIGFELMELAYFIGISTFAQPSFILIGLKHGKRVSNGIWAGMHTVRYFDGKTYEWVGISRQPNIIGKVKRTLGQFTPARWDKDEWHPMLGPLRFVQVLSLCVVFMTVELNTFFLKFCLWIPQKSSSHLQAHTLVVNCNTNHPRIQQLPSGQKSSEEGGSILLAFACNLHSGASYVHQVRPWSISSSDASMADSLLVICCFCSCDLFISMDLADSSKYAEEEAVLTILIVGVLSLSLSLLLLNCLTVNTIGFLACKCSALPSSSRLSFSQKAALYLNGLSALSLLLAFFFYSFPICLLLFLISDHFNQ